MKMSTAGIRMDTHMDTHMVIRTGTRMNIRIRMIMVTGTLTRMIMAMGTPTAIRILTRSSGLAFVLVPMQQ